MWIYRDMVGFGIPGTALYTEFLLVLQHINWILGVAGLILSSP